MAGTVYTVRVRADVSADVSGPWSAEVTGTPADKPAAPTVDATDGVMPGNQQLTVDWVEAPNANGAPITGYTVQWKSGDQDYLAARQATALADATSYTIMNLMNGTPYDVQVKATNRIGDNGWSTEQAGTPAAVPDAPVVTVSNTAANDSALEATQLRVSWEEPEGNGATITGYTVQWKSGGQSYGSSRQVNVTATEITLGDSSSDSPANAALTAGTEYTVRVRANVSADVSGPWSADSTGTPAAVPGAPTVDATDGVMPGNQQLTVDWVEAPNANGAPITEYTVQWKSSGQSYGSSRQASALADATSYTIMNLMNGTPYDVQVKATNRIGDSGWSTEQAGTPAAVPDAPVVTVSNTAANDSALEATQLRVSWEEPEDHESTITGYTVQWKSGAQSYGSDRQVDVTATEITLGDSNSGSPANVALTAGTEYTVRVQATNSRGDGQWSAEVTGTPAAAPANFAAMPTIMPGFQQLEVSWEEPEGNGAPITEYTVRWKSGDQDYGSDRQASALADATSYTIMNLMNGTPYDVQVKATNRIGDNAWSSAATDTPLESLGAVPDAPDVIVTASDEQLTVSWDAPDANGAAITGYTVQWKSGDQDYGSDRQATSTVTSYTIMNLTAGMEYTVQVQATNAKGDSVWSVARTGMPEPVAPASAPSSTSKKSTSKKSTSKKSAPAPAPAPAQPSIIGDSGYATTYLAVDGQSIELRVHPQAGGPASHTFALGSYIRDADLGQTYQIVAGGKRRWVSPDSPLVYAIPWPIVNSMYTFSSLVVAAIPLDESSPPDGFLVRGPNGRIVSYAMSAWRWVPSIPTFQALGYRWCDVNNADGGFFSRISEGSPHAASNQPEDPNYPVCG